MLIIVYMCEYIYIVIHTYFLIVLKLAIKKFKLPLLPSHANKVGVHLKIPL